jgi:hypothetical protein
VVEEIIGVVSKIGFGYDVVRAGGSFSAIVAKPDSIIQATIINECRLTTTAIVGCMWSFLLEYARFLVWKWKGSIVSVVSEVVSVTFHSTQSFFSNLAT